MDRAVVDGEALEWLACLEDFCGTRTAPGFWADLWFSPKTGVCKVSLGGCWEWYFVLDDAELDDAELETHDLPIWYDDVKLIKLLLCNDFGGSHLPEIYAHLRTHYWREKEQGT